MKLKCLLCFLTLLIFGGSVYAQLRPKEVKNADWQHSVDVKGLIFVFKSLKMIFKGLKPPFSGRNAS